MSDPDSARRGPLPPALFLIALVAQGLLHAGLPLVQVVPGTWRLLGALPIVAGFAITVAADGRFKAVETAVNPFGETSTLVTSGPFRYSRNPMYLGMLMVLLGIAALLGSLAPFFVPPIFAWVLTARFIEMEEAKLERVFGPAYREYAESVRRWL